MLRYEMKLIDEKELKERLLYKKIVKYEDDKLYLDDGTIVSVEETDSDCCAYAFGGFNDVKLEAVITDVKVGEYEDNGLNAEYDDEYENYNTVTIYSNQNPVAQAECHANAGNGGYYFRVCSLVIGATYFPVVAA